MRSTIAKFCLLLVVLPFVLPFLTGCGSKSEEKESGDYYTGPMQNKNSSGKSTAKQD